MMTFHVCLKRTSKPKHTRLKFDLEKLKDPNVLETFQAMISGKFTPITIMNNEDADTDSMVMKQPVRSLANIVRTKQNKNWVTAEILYLCDKRRELRKKTCEPEGYEKYKEVNNNIKRCMKKAKENCIGK